MILNIHNILGGDGHIAGVVRHRLDYEGRREFYELRRVGEARFTGQYATLVEAERACFRREVTTHER